MPRTSAMWLIVLDLYTNFEFVRPSHSEDFSVNGHGDLDF